MLGRGPEDLIVSIPPGTTVRDAETGKVITDMVEDGQEFVVAHGGRGGRGNIRFATPRNPAPEIAENGEPGEERELQLELKILADVGLVGFPSVGKSTILSVVTAAKPKIGAYHFTTIVPNLGMVRTKSGESFAMADLPGLIEVLARGLAWEHSSSATSSVHVLSFMLLICQRVRGVILTRIIFKLTRAGNLQLALDGTSTNYCC